MMVRAMPRPAPYTEAINRVLARRRITGIDPRHVEGWMRLEHGTLDALSPQRFAREVSMALACIGQAGLEASERLAVSYGLRPPR